ncbi:MAG: glyoxalase superfamily protein [Gammaproteobacteria bacterium]
MNLKAIPILRIFDEAKAKAFYVDFLGFHVDWEHRFEDDAPLYLQISRDGLRLYLSEHSGDCTPGAKVFVETDAIDVLYAELSARHYKYNRLALEMAPWGDRTLEVIDPFSNRLLFNQSA